MYLSYYGLKEHPFNVTSDPHFLFMSRRHKEAFAHLVYGIQERKGFLAITGEIGAGKTTLCRAILNQLGPETKTAFIVNPELSEMQLLGAIAEDFGIELPKRANKLIIYRLINKFLLEQLSKSRNVVLIVDEAQNLRTSLLEQIRLLSNLETEKEKLIQIALVGQPQLRDKLRSPRLEQLHQRISVRYHILPIDKDEVAEYINHRLEIAGSDGHIRFMQDAIDEVYSFSLGIPRLINMACDKALLFGYVLERKEITGDLVRKSADELKGVFV
ncbi:MAG: AAA family ATPase [Candidatus Omnitrophota bacterium]